MLLPLPIHFLYKDESSYYFLVPLVLGLLWSMNSTDILICFALLSLFTCTCPRQLLMMIRSLTIQRWWFLYVLNTFLDVECEAGKFLNVSRLQEGVPGRFDIAGATARLFLAWLLQDLARRTMKSCSFLFAIGLHSDHESTPLHSTCYTLTFH
jgi:hypothetical protein